MSIMFFLNLDSSINFDVTQSQTFSSSEIYLVMDLPVGKQFPWGAGGSYGFVYSNDPLTPLMSEDPASSIPSFVNYLDTNLEPGTYYSYQFFYDPLPFYFNFGDLYGDVLTICTGDELSYSKTTTVLKISIDVQYCD